jgi:hypothetical protein
MPVDATLLLSHPVVLLHMLPITTTKAWDPDIVSPPTVAFPEKVGNSPSWAACLQVACELGTI